MYLLSHRKHASTWPQSKRMNIRLACTWPHPSHNHTASTLQLLQALASALGVYYNSSGETRCLNTSKQATANLGDQGWNFQVCAQWQGLYTHPTTCKLMGNHSRIAVSVILCRHVLRWSCQCALMEFTTCSLITLWVIHKLFPKHTLIHCNSSIYQHALVELECLWNPMWTTVRGKARSILGRDCLWREAHRNALQHCLQVTLHVCVLTNLSQYYTCPPPNSNGLLDPWHVGGVQESLSETLVAVIIPSGAHHIDLRRANAADPPDVKAARQLEMQQISKWLSQYYHSKDT